MEEMTGKLKLKFTSNSFHKSLDENPGQTVRNCHGDCSAVSESNEHSIFPVSSHVQHIYTTVS
jgi:hypothetical protein